MTKRTKAKPTAPATPAPAERPEGYRQTMHIGLYAADLADLDKIAENMRRHPIIGRLHNNIGRETAARHAIAEYAKTMG